MSRLDITRARLPNMSDEALAYTIADLRDVIAIQESAARDGARPCKLDNYIDELHAALAERRRRAGADTCAACGRPL